MADLEQLISERRSTRMFLPDKPVPRQFVEEALALAMRAPSNSNIQPWRMVFASGAARGRPVAALLDEARSKPPRIPALPEEFAPIRRETGALVYGSMGIAREDTEGRRVAILCNWEFFRAPLAGIVCIHRALGPVDSLGAGMFLQTLLLALTALGLGTCVQVSISGYPEIVHQQLHIPSEYVILCGLGSAIPTPTCRQTSCTRRAIPSRKGLCFSTPKPRPTDRHRSMGLAARFWNSPPLARNPTAMPTTRDCCAG
jgi:nitroreductase